MKTSKIMKILNTIAYVLCAVIGFTYSDSSYLTTYEVPLYIRQSWVKVNEHIRTRCIGETGVNPTWAYKSLMETEIRNDPNLKSFYKCLCVGLNLIEETTGYLNEQEYVRQIEGCTAEVFKKCNEKVKQEVDLDVKCFNMYVCIVHAVAKPKSPNPHNMPGTYEHNPNPPY